MKAICEDCRRVGAFGNVIRVYAVGKREIELCYKCYLKLHRMNPHIKDKAHGERK